MGGMCQPTTDTTPGYSSTVAGTEIPEWVSHAGQQIFGQAANLASQPYTPYPLPRIADFSGLESMGINMAGANIGNYQPGLAAAGGTLDASGQVIGAIPGQIGNTGANQNFAMGAAGGAATPWNTGAMNTYMNPFTSGVLDVAAGDLNRQFDIQQRNTDAAAGGAGAYGDARHGILNAENERNRGRTLSDLYTTGYGNAYNSALGAFGADQNRLLQSGNLALGAGNLGLAGARTNLQAGGALGNLANQYAQLGATTQNLASNDINQLMGIGGMQRGLAQSSLDTAYQDFLEQRAYPREQVNFAIGALKGVPYSERQWQNTHSMTPQLGTSPFGQAAGALTGLYGAYNMFNRPGTGGGTR
jgi:hypothetical protein